MEAVTWYTSAGVFERGPLSIKKNLLQKVQEASVIWKTAPSPNG